MVHSGGKSHKLAYTRTATENRKPSQLLSSQSESIPGQQRRCQDCAWYNASACRKRLVDPKVIHFKAENVTDLHNAVKKKFLRGSNSKYVEHFFSSETVEFEHLWFAIKLGVIIKFGQTR